MQARTLLPFLALVAVAMRPSLARSQETEAAPSPKRSTASSFTQFAKHLVVVDGDVSRGSASIIKFRGNPLIVTNAHVLSGNSRVDFRRLNNDRLQTGTFGLARAVDLAVFAQDDVEDGLEMLDRVDDQAAIGDEVLVLGNSSGSAVATELPGKIVGIGPELVEVDAKFVAGNSGSPIIHLKSGKVLAIATFATLPSTDPLADDTRFREVRRFGLRLDTVASWEYPTWEKFSGEARQLAFSLQAITRWIVLANDLSDDGYLDPSLYSDADERFQSRVSQLAADLQRPRMSANYYSAKKVEFLRWVENQAAVPTTQVRSELFTDFHRDSLEQVIRVRGKMQRLFGLLRTAQRGSDRFDLLAPGVLGGTGR